MDSNALHPHAIAGMCGVLCVVATVAILTKTAKKDTKFVTVPGYPVLGNLLDMHLPVILDKMSEFKNKYGNIFYLRVLSQKFIHISDAKLSREVLGKRPRLLRRVVTIEGMAKKLGYLPYGFFNINDALIWNKIKKLTAPAFSKQNLSNMSKIIYEEAMAFVAKVDTLSKTDNDIVIAREAARYTTGVINKVAFGNEPVEYFKGELFYQDINLTLTVLLEAALFPLPEWVWRLTPMYQTELKVRAANDRFTVAAQEVIDRQRALQATMDEEEKKNLHGLIDIMLRQEDVTDEEILANVKTFYIAGSDTTSVTITWALFLLCQHPDCVARLREEAAPFFASDLSSKATSDISDAIMSLEYAHAVFKETVRLYPVGPLQLLDFVDASESLELSNGLVIPGDHTIMVQMWTCMLDEENFPDPKKFDPSRWFTEDKALLARMETAFLGFGAGPRACPGMNLAMREGAVALAALHHHFDLHLACPVEEIQVDYKLTMQPNKLPIRATKKAL